jgi:hypothetical protein
VVQAADEVVDGRVRSQLADERLVGGPQPFALEADEQRDLRRVESL